MIELRVKSINVQRATKIFLVALVLATAIFSAMLVREKKRDTADILQQNIENKLATQSIDQPTTVEAEETRDSAAIAKLVADNKRLWGPLIPPPPKRKPPPPKPPNLAQMARGLSIVAVIGDPSGGDPVKFLIDDNGVRSLKVKGNKLRKFVIKDYDDTGIVLQFGLRTHTLKLAGK